MSRNVMKQHHWNWNRLQKHLLLSFFFSFLFCLLFLQMPYVFGFGMWEMTERESVCVCVRGCQSRLIHTTSPVPSLLFLFSHLLFISFHPLLSSDQALENHFKGSGGRILGERPRSCLVNNLLSFYRLWFNLDVFWLNWSIFSNMTWPFSRALFLFDGDGD